MSLYVVEGFDGILIGPFSVLREAMDLIPGSAVRELIDPQEFNAVVEEDEEEADDEDGGEEVLEDDHDEATCPLCQECERSER
jgi:hypothetical protein